MLPGAPPWLTEVPFAHRGLFDERRPENSLGAMAEAADAGYGIELDVRITDVGEAIVHHDEDLRRSAGVDRPVRSLRQGERAGLRLFGTDEPLPVLAEVLDVVGGRVPLLIEVKYPLRLRLLGPAVLAPLAAYRGPHAVQSFDPRVTYWLRRHAPSVPRGQLAGIDDHVAMAPRVRRFLDDLRANRPTQPHYIAYAVDRLPSPVVDRWRREVGGPVIAWTVRTDEQRARAEAHADNYIFEPAGLSTPPPAGRASAEHDPAGRGDPELTQPRGDRDLRA